MTRDIFRPKTEPERTIYDAFQREAEKREGRSFEDWHESEQQAVWRAARDMAQQSGLRIPTIEEVRCAEHSACGHVDYGLKWSLYVADAMRERVR